MEGGCLENSDVLFGGSVFVISFVLVCEVWGGCGSEDDYSDVVLLCE